MIQNRKNPYFNKLVGTKYKQCYQFPSTGSDYTGKKLYSYLQGHQTKYRFIIFVQT